MTTASFIELSEEYARSADGTKIAFRRVGTGPPVVIVHGTLGSANSWWPVAVHLADRFELFLVERRNRGASGTGRSPHSLQREAEDLRAVIARVGHEVSVIGHSYGGAVALEAALLAGGEEIRKLVLYEASLPSAAPGRVEAIDELRRLVERGSLEAALLLFLKRLSSLRTSETNAARTSAGWPELVLRVVSVPDEVQAIHGLPSGGERYRPITVPTLLLIGELSGDAHERNLETLLHALPDARVARLGGQGHLATVGDPGLLASVVGGFLAA